MQKLLGFLVLIIGLVLGGKIIFDYYSFQIAPLELKFQTLWAEDMDLLAHEKKYPKGWEEISEIKYHLLTEKTKSWLKNIKAPIVLKKDGSHRLEITITDWSEQGKVGIVVQYHLINKTSGDLVNEFGRTFILDNPTSQIK